MNLKVTGMATPMVAAHATHTTKPAGVRSSGAAIVDTTWAAVTAVSSRSLIRTSSLQPRLSMATPLRTETASATSASAAMISRTLRSVMPKRRVPRSINPSWTNVRLS